MEKKRNNDEAVYLALDEHGWINSPVAYTAFNKNFSLVQQDVMLQVSGKLQTHFARYLNEGRYLSKENPNGGIAKEDLVNMEPIRLELADLGVDSNHYDEAIAMVKKITNIKFHLPRFDMETGLRKGDDYMPIFSKIFIPKSFETKSSESYQYQRSAEKMDEDGNSVANFRRDGYVEVTINVEAAKAIFDMSKGYFNHLERIAYFCHSMFTSRLYLLLMKYVSKGQMHPAIDYFELKDFLGMYERQEDSDVIVNEKYQKFSQFRKQVLNVAKRDMERLCEENKIEIMLACTDECKDGYEPIYRGSAKRGNPDKIKFHIKRTPLGIARELELHRGASEQRLCVKLMELYPSLDEPKLQAFLADVPEDLWVDFKKYAYRGVPKAVEQPHRWSGTTEEFVFYIMEQWVAQRQPKQEKKAEKDLFSQAPVERPKPEPQGEIGKYAEEWQKLLQTYNGALKPWLLKAHHYGTAPTGFLLILFDDKKTLEEFNAECDKPENKQTYMDMMQILAGLIGKSAARILVRGVVSDKHKRIY